LPIAVDGANLGGATTSGNHAKRRTSYRQNRDKRNHDKQPQQAGKRYIRSDDLTTPLHKEQMNESLHDSPSHEAARLEARDQDRAVLAG